MSGAGRWGENGRVDGWLLIGFLLGMMKIFKNCGYGCITLGILKTIKLYTSNKWIICEIHLNKAVAKKKKRYTKQIWTKKLGGNLNYWQMEFTNVIIDKCTIDSKIRWKWRKRLILFVMNIYSQFKILATESNGVFFKNMTNRVYLRDARVTQHQKIYQSDRQRVT